MKSKSSGILPDDTDYDCFHNGGEFICGRKRKAYAGDASLLPVKRKTDLSGKSAGFFPVQHDGIADLICSYDARAGAGSIFHHRKYPCAVCRMAGDPVPSHAVRLSDRGDPDRKRFGKGAERGRIPAGGGLPYYPGDPTCGRTVRGSNASKYMDTSGAERGVRAACVGAAAQSGGKI